MLLAKKIKLVLHNSYILLALKSFIQKVYVNLKQYRENAENIVVECSGNTDIWEQWGDVLGGGYKNTKAKMNL
jgi:hypothetical protein